MNPIYKDFDQFKMQYVSGSQHQAYISCWKQGVYVGTIVFVKDDTLVPPNRVGEQGNILLYYPLGRFNDVITILRYEKPLYLWLNPDNLFGNVGTTIEPIGEQES